MSIEIILQSSYNFKVKKIFLKILFFLFFSSHSFACPLLQVPIGSPVSSAVETFEFLDTYNARSVLPAAVGPNIATTLFIIYDVT